MANLPPLPPGFKLDQADPADFTDRYNTQLPPQDEQRFQAWSKSLGQKGSTYDYDLRGAFKDGAAQAANGHFPDTYKKPNHPTFSTDSKYNGADGFQGGAWGKQQDGSWTFAPTESILKLHDQEDLKSYFQRVEPGNKLVLPPAGGAGKLPPLPPGFVLDSASQPPSAHEGAAKSGGEHAADAAGVLLKHPFTATTGMAENALSSFTGGVGSLADALTGSDPGAHDWAYRPRTEAGQEIARLGSEEGAKAGQKYDKAFGTGPLASTIKERGQEAMGAIGTITALGGLRGIAGAGKVTGNVGPRSPAGLRGAVPGEEVPVVGAREAAPAERPAQLAKVSEAAPSKAELKSAATAAYKKAEDAGVVITPESFDKAKGVIGSMLEKEGIDPTLHPATTAALKRINETTGPVTLEKLETLRRIAKSAESTINPADRRLAAKVIDTIDGYADTLSAKDVSAGNPEAASAFREARSFYSRARKADELDELMSRAELSAPNFSGSGMENAVRTEFRSLAKNQRRMRLFTADERAAIVRVAKGGKVENALRMLGKFAPTGSISTAISAGSGFMAGGPLGAVAVPAVGAAARYGATRMTMRNAARANELVRRGPQPRALKSKRPETESAPAP